VIDEPDYLIPRDEPGDYLVGAKARSLISMALREKAANDDERAAADAWSAGILKEQARAARMLADVLDISTVRVECTD
jgi:hypothetical protein